MASLVLFTALLVLVVEMNHSETEKKELEQAHVWLSRAGVQGARSAAILRKSARIYQKHLSYTSSSSSTAAAADGKPTSMLATIAAAAVDDARAVEAQNSQALRSAIAKYEDVATRATNWHERRAACMRLGELYYYFKQ